MQSVRQTSLRLIVLRAVMRQSERSTAATWNLRVRPAGSGAPDGSKLKEKKRANVLIRVGSESHD